MMKIGPTFANELVAANVSLDGLSWDIVTGAIRADNDSHLAAAQVVLASHDPTKQLPVSGARSKLSLVRAARASGQWTSLKALIASHVEWQDDWDAATDIDRQDPLLLGAIASGAVNAATIDALFVAALAE